MLQDLENAAKIANPDNQNQRFNPLYKNTAKLDSLKVGVVKEYLKEDLQESIELLKYKQDNLKNIADDMTWEDYVQAEVRAMTYMSNGKSIKGITGAIAAYNVFKKRADNATATFGTLNREQTGFTCGTATCKERGQKIKEALTVLATFSPDALGSLGVLDVTASAVNWLGKSAYNLASKAVGSTSKPGYIDPAYGTFLGLPPEVLADINQQPEKPNANQNANQTNGNGIELVSANPNTSNGTAANDVAVNGTAVNGTAPQTSRFTTPTQQIGKDQLAATKKSIFSGWFGGNRTRRRR